MMKHKILILFLLVVLSGCALVSSDIESIRDRVFVSIGFSLDGVGFKEDYLFYPGDGAANFENDRTQYIFDSEPFAEYGFLSNPHAYYSKEYNSNSYKYYLYLNDIPAENIVRPTYYAMYRNVGSNQLHNEVLTTRHETSLFDRLDLEAPTFIAQREERNVWFSYIYSVVRAPKFKSITITEYDEDDNILKVTNDASDLKYYQLEGERVLIVATYLNNQGETQEII